MHAPEVACGSVAEPVVGGSESDAGPSEVPLTSPMDVPVPPVDVPLPPVVGRPRPARVCSHPTARPGRQYGSLLRDSSGSYE